MSSIYDGQFYGNILVVGRTGCGKTTFLEKLGLNNFFGNIIKTEWISGIDIDKKERPKSNLILVTKQKFMWQKDKINLILRLKVLNFHHVRNQLTIM